MNEEAYIIKRWNIAYDAYCTSANSTGYWMNPSVKTRGYGYVGDDAAPIDSPTIKKEVETIVKEMEEDKQKHLPIFDPKDLSL